MQKYVSVVRVGETDIPEETLLFPEMNFDLCTQTALKFVIRIFVSTRLEENCFEACLPSLVQLVPPDPYTVSNPFEKNV